MNWTSKAEPLFRNTQLEKLHVIVVAVDMKI
jgi:hypothetical protein